MPQFPGESNKKNKIKPGCTFSQEQEDEIQSFGDSQEDVRSSGTPIIMSLLELIASECSLRGHSHRIFLTTTNALIFAMILQARKVANPSRRELTQVAFTRRNPSRILERWNHTSSLIKRAKSPLSMGESDQFPRGSTHHAGARGSERTKLSLSMILHRMMMLLCRTMNFSMM